MRNRTVNRTVVFAAALTVAVAGLVTMVSDRNADATTPSDAVAYVPATPCRLVDTRPDHQVGGRSAPLGPTEVHSVVGRGAAGACIGSTAIPATATALQLNVTAVGATEPTHLTVFPTGEARPNASSLNPVPGQPPVPNAVTATLGTGGKFDVYNHAGEVHLVVDVVGFYTEHDHDDRYYTRAQVESLTASPLQRTVIVGSGGTDAENGQRFVDAVAEVAAAGGSVADPWHLHLEPGDYVVPTSLTLPPGTVVTGRGVVVDLGTNVLTVTDNDLADLDFLGTSLVLEVRDELVADGIGVYGAISGSDAVMSVHEGAAADLRNTRISAIGAGVPRSAIDAMSGSMLLLRDSNLHVSGDGSVAVRTGGSWLLVDDTEIGAFGSNTVGVHLAGANAVIDGVEISEAEVSLRIEGVTDVDVAVSHSTLSGSVDSYVSAPELEIAHTTVDGGVIGSATCVAVTSGVFGAPGFYATSCPAVI